jgi:hypothetical protein
LLDYSTQEEGKKNPFKRWKDEAELLCLCCVGNRGVMWHEFYKTSFERTAEIRLQFLVTE